MTKVKAVAITQPKTLVLLRILAMAYAFTLGMAIALDMLTWQFIAVGIVLAITRLVLAMD